METSTEHRQSYDRQQMQKELYNQKVSGGTRVAEYLCICIAYVILVLTFPVSWIFTLKVVVSFERAVIFRLGRLRSGGARGPGLFFVLPCIDTYENVDLRTVTVLIQPQEVLTRDSCTIYVDLVLFYRVSDPLKVVVNVKNYKVSTWNLAATTLRNVLGTKTLAECLTQRDEIALKMTAILDNATHIWGIKVEHVELKDVALPPDMQRAMAAEAEATRDAQAKVICAKGELDASEYLKKASDILNTSPASIQLRYLQTLTNIATENDSTIIFPIPVGNL